MSRSRRGWVSLLTAVLVLAGGPLAAAKSWRPPTAPASAVGSEVARAWFALALDLTRSTTGFSPPVAARAFGYLGVTLYESVVPGMPGYRSLSGQLNDLGPLPEALGSGYHWATAANAALATMARHMYGGATAQAAANLAAIDGLERALQGDLAASPGLVRRSQAFGRAVADALYAWSLTDGGHEGYLRNFPTSYQPPVGPGLWVPTPPAFQRALQPAWGQNRPFVLASGADCEPPPPPAFSPAPGSPFHEEALEVYDTVNTLTDEQEVIARFWSDDPGATATPPGHSISIATQVLEELEASLGEAAETYARVGMSVADAFIACWWVKYVHNLLRPVTFIANHIDPNWPPLLNTPPFPEYPSGHSTQSGAAAEVLTDLFGDLPFVDRTHVDRGFAPRPFDSFHAFADEAAVSRLYGGIHFRSAIERGLEQGTCVGSRVNALIFRAP
jgi:hypothetical protein